MGPFGWYLTLVWVLVALLTVSGSMPEVEASLEKATPWITLQGDNRFVRTEGACDARWASWPQVQERALADGTVMIWHIQTSVGNMMKTLNYILPIVHLLEVGLIIDFDLFPAMRVAFEPALIKWDVDPDPFLERASEIAKVTDPGDHHAVKFKDGLLILNDSQLERFAAAMRIEGRSHKQLKRRFYEKRHSKLRQYLPETKRIEPAPPCVWNMLFQRSPSMMASMDAHSPWDTTKTLGSHQHYNAWHIRTSEGESETRFKGNHYIFDGQEAADICPLFLSTIDIVKDACPALVPAGATSGLPIYISSNSKSMARSCSAFAEDHGVEAGFVDLGIDARDSHTAYSTNPNTSVNAFIDFLQLMDASVVIRSGSSFSSAITDMKGYRCLELDHGERPRLYACLPLVC